MKEKSLRLESQHFWILYLFGVLNSWTQTSINCHVEQITQDGAKFEGDFAVSFFCGQK